MREETEYQAWFTSRFINKIVQYKLDLLQNVVDMQSHHCYFIHVCPHEWLVFHLDTTLYHFFHINFTLSRINVARVMDRFRKPQPIFDREL